MSSFLCEICGRDNQDSDAGYIAGCEHYPPEHNRPVSVYFSDDTAMPSVTAFYDGAWYKSVKSQKKGLSVHPVTWREER